MLDRTQILRTIDEAYAARTAGDKAALAAYWAPDATYRLAGAASLIPPVVPVGPGGAEAAVNTLIDLFRFHDLQRLDAVIEGNKAAVHWQVTVSTEGKDPVTCELYDLWTFDENGHATALLQFTDTALLVALLG